MRFFDWLFARTPAETDPAPTITIRVTIDGTTTETAFTPDLSAIEAADSTDHTAQQVETKVAKPAVMLDGPCDCGDAFCVIDYTDASGASSERRVSLKTISEQNGHLYLNAFCFERAAPRQFRLDRINHFISEDGEVIDPVTFLQEVIGIPLRPATESEQKTLAATAAYLAAMRPGLAILTAAARADGHVHISEVDAIQIWSEREAAALHRHGAVHLPPTIEVVEAIARHISLMRPLLPGLKTQIRLLKGWDNARIDRLFRALGETVSADGVILQVEIDFIEQIRDSGDHRQHGPFAAAQNAASDPKAVDGLRGAQFVFTGELVSMSRSAAMAAVRQMGAEVTGQVTERTTYLVAGFEAALSKKKITQAESLGAKIIGESEFLAIIGHN